MKALIKDLRGILVNNAIVAAILNRKKKQEGYRPDMSGWANAVPSSVESVMRHDNTDLRELIQKCTDATPKPERVQLTVAEIKEIMDEHEVRMRYRAMVNDQPALEVISQDEGRYYREAAPDDVSRQVIDAIYDGIPQSQVSLGFAGQVMANNMAIKAMLDPKHERDTQAVRSPGFGFQNTDRSTTTHPDIYPNQSFSTPVEFENRAQRRRREQEEKRNKKRGKK